MLAKDAAGLYKKYFADRDFERLDLFALLRERFQIESAVYPGSFVHVTPAFVYPITTFIDSDKNAKRFFAHPEFAAFIHAHKKYEQEPVIAFYPGDYREILDGERGRYDLLISQFAGFVSMHCKAYLKIGGILLVNNSHGDASMASIDTDYVLVGAAQKRARQHRLYEENLDAYFVPKKETDITKAYLEKIQRGVGYQKTASAYLFRRVR